MVNFVQEILITGFFQALPDINAEISMSISVFQILNSLSTAYLTANLPSFVVFLHEPEVHLCIMCGLAVRTVPLAQAGGPWSLCIRWAE